MNLQKLCLLSSVLLTAGCGGGHRFGPERPVAAGTSICAHLEGQYDNHPSSKLKASTVGAGLWSQLTGDADDSQIETVWLSCDDNTLTIERHVEGDPDRRFLGGESRRDGFTTQPDTNARWLKNSRIFWALSRDQSLLRIDPDGRLHVVTSRRHETVFVAFLPFGGDASRLEARYERIE